MSGGKEWESKEEVDSLVADMENISKVFFLNIVTNLNNQKKLTKISLFQQAFGNFSNIKANSWKKAMFKCVNRHFQIIANDIETSLERNDLQSASYLLGEIQQPLKQSLLLNCQFEAQSNPELYTIEDMYEIVDRCSQKANAQQEVIFATEIL